MNEQSRVQVMTAESSDATFFVSHTGRDGLGLN